MFCVQNYKLSPFVVCYMMTDHGQHGMNCMCTNKIHDFTLTHTHEKPNSHEKRTVFALRMRSFDEYKRTRQLHSVENMARKKIWKWTQNSHEPSLPLVSIHSQVCGSFFSWQMRMLTAEVYVGRIVTWNTTTAADKFNLCINLIYIVCKSLKCYTVSGNASTVLGRPSVSVALVEAYMCRFASYNQIK